METAQEFRREADMVERVARCISLNTDKERLFRMARQLRQRAERMESRSFSGRLATRTTS